MFLARSNWPQIEAYLKRCHGVVVPLGSIEQHGDQGLIGTDSVCAELVAGKAADHCKDMLILPTVSFAPAQFNLEFPGTLSIRSTTLIQLLTDLVSSLVHQGFRKFYFLNGHGANLAPVRSMIHDWYQQRTLSDSHDAVDFRLRSWWDFPGVDQLRKQFYGDQEGMHVTPSEIAITMTHTSLGEFKPDSKFKPLSRDFLKDHAADQHQDACRHRQNFQNGRVGSNPLLATPAQGQQILETAASEMAGDYSNFLGMTYD